MKIHTPFLVLFAAIILNSQKAHAQQSELQSAPINYRISDSIFSEVLGESRDFWVRLPENYHPNNGENYAVIYLLDGMSLESTLEVIYGNYWGHYLPHMILVGISNREHRTRDLTTSEVKTRRGSTMSQETGGAENFTHFIEDELIPYIDSHYPTMPYRTLIGHSYAGLFTINMLINHNDLFQNYIAIDPSLDWDNQKLLTEAKTKLSTESFQGKSLYMSLAAEQLHMWDESITIDNVMEDSSEFTLFARSIIELSKCVKTHESNGLNFSWNVYHEDLHGTVPLPTIRDGLIFLFEWYQFKSPQKYNNPETSVEELAALLNEQEQIYTQNFGVPTAPMIEEMLNGYGYMFLQMGQPEKARIFFELNIKHNPTSANAHDSLAEYYELQNDKKRALVHLNKAYGLSGEEYYKDRIEALSKE